MEKATSQLLNPSRRQLVVGAAGAAAVLAAAPLLAQEHHHHAMPTNQGLTKAALNCVAEGEACIEHCIQSFQQGSTELAKCMETAREAVEACQLLAKYSAGNSPHLKKLAALCIDVCNTCAKECEQHAKKHPSCKACLDSCNECIDACKKVA